MKQVVHKFYERIVSTNPETDELTVEQLDQVTAIPTVYPVSDDFQAFITQDAEFDQKLRKQSK